ncbi:hypothetical protein BB558_001056 [Smittium angustum]|uniref:Uncharacterized protein n=1 Tax=Smittium angustum TaxID=133377 RepID=A0A2U1JCF4_SMIAN|nr:hypothetical protein BB558_001056 [Smittium angustum]
MNNPDHSTISLKTTSTTQFPWMKNKLFTNGAMTMPSQNHPVRSLNPVPPIE